MTLTPKVIAELRRLHEAKEYKEPVCRGSLVLGSACRKCEKCRDRIALITLMRNSLPALLDRIEALEGALKHIKSETEHFQLGRGIVFDAWTQQRAESDWGDFILEHCQDVCSKALEPQP